MLQNYRYISDRYDYAFIWERATFLGLRDSELMISLSHEGPPDHHFELKINAFGHLKITRGETPIDPQDWRREKTRILFQYFLTHRNRFIPKSVILDHLWPHLGPKEADHSFRVTLSLLNSALEPDRDRRVWMRKDSGSYAFFLNDRCWLDVAAFEELMKEGDRLIAQQQHSRAIACYRAAIDLYQGPYLEGGPEYEDWLISERSRLQSLFWNTVRNHIAPDLLAQQQFTLLESLCYKMLAFDVSCEEAYLWLMKSQLAQGQRPQVLKIYRQCELILARDLDLSPHPALLQLAREAEK